MQRPISLLIIDDDPVLCYLLSKALKLPEFIVTVASDGCSGIAMAIDLHPEIILLDLCLPDIDGFTLLAELQRKQVQSTVLMTSCIVAVRWRQQARDAGVAGILQKPFSLVELRDVINRMARITRHFCMSEDAQNG
jgi:DNA-binding response OmpR family regulator